MARTTKRGLKRRKSQSNRTKPRLGARLWIWTKRLFVLGLVLGLLGVLCFGGALWYYGRDLPDIASLRNYQPPQTTRVFDRHGELIGEIFQERRTVIPMKDIPRVLVLCTLAAEDADFYRHEGLDYPGIARAIYRDIQAGGRVQGASTITQQVVKLLLLSPERTIPRKLRELILTRRLEKELSKDEILHLYLNHINYGHGRYGVQEAAQFYFSKNATELSLAEASLIAGVPQAPARLSPKKNPTAAKRRQKFIFNQLTAKRESYWADISIEDIAEAKSQRVVLSESGTDSSAPEVMAIVRKELRGYVGAEAFKRGGHTVHTTIDLSLQRKARKAVQNGLHAIDKRQRFRGPLRAPKKAPAIEDVSKLVFGKTYDAVVTGRDNTNNRVLLDVGGHNAFVSLDTSVRENPKELSPAGFAKIDGRARVTLVRKAAEGEKRSEVRLELGPQAAAIVLEPRSRHILAMIGGYSERAGFNRATQAVRQPGSTFKPIVYSVGLTSRLFTPATVVMDAPAVYDQWKPKNYEAWRHKGPIRLREALANSVNVVAVRVMEEVTPERVVSFAKQLGVSGKLEPNMSLALGATEVKPIEMVNAYATFASGGRYQEPILITRIEGPDGDVELRARPAPKDVMTPAEAYIITSMMTSVVQEGTAQRAKKLGVAAAGKTGTTNESRDAWFVGFTPSLVGGVWVGFDDRRPLGRRESGGRSALPIWVDIMKAAGTKKKVRDFARPSGIVTEKIDPATGLLAYDGFEGAIEEVFLSGTEPKETARPSDVADPGTFMMEQMGGAI